MSRKKDPDPYRLAGIHVPETCLVCGTDLPGQEWRDHIPSGYEDMAGYGQVSCSCGWDSSDKLGWEDHIDVESARSAVRTACGVTRRAPKP